jgi:imidazolonepropionase-like amidohydrolase
MNLHKIKRRIADDPFYYEYRFLRQMSQLKKYERIFAGWLIDGSGGPIQTNILIKIEEGLIRSMETVSPDELRDLEKRGSRILDLSRCTVMPGMIDCHVHLSMSGTEDKKVRQNQLKASYDEIEEKMSAHLHQHLTHGIVAVRDGGDKNGHVLQYKRNHMNTKKTPIHLHTAGWAWHREGRYGGWFGRALTSNDSLAEAITNEKSEIDHVKVVNSGINSLTQFGLETPPQFTLSEMEEAVLAAKKRGLSVMVHANGHSPVSIALNSGCHSVEHGFFMGGENLEKMAEQGITWVPTAGTMKAYAESSRPKTTESEISRKTLDHQLGQISEAARVKVLMALGTDAGSPGVHHGRGAIDELKLFLAAGLSIPEIVRCATLNGARLLGLDRLGLLVPDMEATLIAVKGKPDRLPESLNDIELVLISGKSFEFRFFPFPS